MSLRARLLVISLCLVAAGLAAAGWAAHRALDEFLVDRVDQQMLSARTPSLGHLLDPRVPPPGGVEPGGGLLPLGSVVELRSAAGRVTAASQVTWGDAGDPPALPADVAGGLSRADVAGIGPARLLSVDAQAVPGGERAAAGDRLVIAVPLRDVQDTLSRLVWIEVAVGAATLLALAALAWWLVHVGLRPIARMERTAREIAAGDLGRRVDAGSPGTEAGRLAAAFNAMLERIEAAFAERRAAEERLRRFVADASHELQTPLTSVRGYAELFRRGAARDPAGLDTAMRRIEAEATRMGVLVDDLLLLARLDQGRPMEREPVDLSELATDLAGDARAVEPDRPIEVVADGPVRVMGDQMRLRQVVANLLGNTRAHTPPGTPVRVRVAAAGDEALIEVADRGPGLDPEDAARVFERFFRADPSRARASGGSGLGLSIVAAIAGAHGGRAEVESCPGAGATFRVRLPLAPVAVPG